MAFTQQTSINERNSKAKTCKNIENMSLSAKMLIQQYCSSVRPERSFHYF